MWDVLLRRWLDMLLWWVPRKKEPPPRAGGATRKSACTCAPIGRARRPRCPLATGTAADAGEGRRAQVGRAACAACAQARAAQPEKTVAPPVPDDLTEIKGIGPAMQNKLRALGITTFADLAAADPDQLMAQLKGSQPLSRGRVRHWTETARQRVRT